MRVLVVDDDPAGRMLLETIFASAGHATTSASDGVEALEHARGSAFDVLVTDILMPRMDGYQLCREWKGDPGLCAAPVVFYTATYTAPEDREFADEVGADLFIIKPTDSSELLAAVEELIGAVSAGRLAAREHVPAEEADLLRGHNERLVAKLEHKVGELQAANTELESAVEALDTEGQIKAELVQRLHDDIERRKQAEAQLERTAELLAAVVDGSPVGIVATDETGAVRVWNPFAERLLGWSAEDLHGKPYPLAEGDALSEILKTAASGVATTSVRELAGANGDRVSAEVHTAPLHDDQGRFDGLVTLFADLTERARLDRLKEEFVQVVSHELRTPLTTVIASGDILASMGDRLDPERTALLVDRIRAQGTLLAQLVDDLIGVLQIQAGGLTLDPTLVDIVDIVRQRAGSQPMGEGHELQLDLPDEAVLVACDPVQIGLALKNVLANAVKYSPDGGVIEVSLHASAIEVRIVVADHGVGIPSDQIAGVFEMFTQVDMSTTRRFGGLGIGLYLTRRIVEAHQGHVEVASAPGEGAAFTIVLPRSGVDATLLNIV